MVLTLTRSDHSPYLRSNMDNQRCKKKKKKNRRQHWAVKSDCCQMTSTVKKPEADGQRQKYIFLIIFSTFMFLPPILSTSQTPSRYPCLDRSLSSHQDTNQDFPAAGPGSLGEEVRGEKGRCLIIDNKRGI